MGRSAKPQGNAEIQYYPTDKKLRLRLTEQVAYSRLKNIALEVGLNFEDLNSKIKYS